MVNWDAEDIVQFKTEAQTLQQEYCDLLGDREWDEIEKNDWEFLRKKVGFGVFGPPSETPTDENKGTGYPEEQLTAIEKICHKLVDTLDFNKHKVHFACIFVVVKAVDRRYPVPIFKIKRDVDSSDKCDFIDSNCRKYSNWKDYLGNNTNEKCIYCYPTSGLYEIGIDNKVCVDFGTSPACKVINQVLNIFDKAAAAVAIASTVVGVAAICTVPIAGPIMAASAIAGASTGAYGVTRNSYALYDRASHSQSIALFDTEARGLWLSIVGSSLGFAQGQMVAAMTNTARMGGVMGTAGRIAFLAVQTGSLTVNGIGIVHGLALLIDKNERHELTALDVFQFSASLLFFTNSAINFKTANTIIKEVQRDVIDGHRQDLSGRAKKVFDRKTRGLRGGGDELQGNAKVVKHVNHVGNTKEFYELMANKNVNSGKVRITPKGFKGSVTINKELKMHPLKLLNMDTKAQEAIFKSTKSFTTGNITKGQYNSDMKTIFKENRLQSNTARVDTTRKLCQYYGKENLKDIVIGGKKIFANIKPSEIDRLAKVLKGDKITLKMAIDFANTRGCNSPKDFANNIECFKAIIDGSIKSYEVRYQKDLQDAKKRPDFNQSEFDRRRGIPAGVKRTDFFKQKVVNKFKSPPVQDLYIEHYESLKTKIRLLNRKGGPCFSTDDNATCHYLKHKDFGKLGKVTPEGYFQLLGEVVGNPKNITNTSHNQVSGHVSITYVDSSRGLKAVKIGDTIATFMYNEQFIKKE